MPIISIFYGIIVRLNYNDHNPPHIHVEYQGMKAIFEIKSASLIAGEIPKNARKLVVSWMRKNTSGLLKNWKLAQNHDELLRIPGED